MQHDTYIPDAVTLSHLTHTQGSGNQRGPFSGLPLIGTPLRREDGLGGKGSCASHATFYMNPALMLSMSATIIRCMCLMKGFRP